MMSSTPHAVKEVTKATAILRHAIDMEKLGYLHPATLKKRMVTIGIALLFGFAGLTASIFAIRQSATSSQQLQMLLGLFVVLSSAVLLASISALVLALWNAYVYQYVLALEAQSEIVEYQSISVAEAALNLASDKDFQRELANELKTVPNITPDALAQATVTRLAEKAKTVAIGGTETQ